MPILGITGGIASGKSTFRKQLLELLDADFFDADACARELLEEDERIRREIVQKLDPSAYTADGRPDRPRIRELIYQDAAKKSTLEAILHPVIRQRWSQQAQEASAQSRIFIVDIPLLFETHAEKLFDLIVTVACSHETQLARLAEHRGLAHEISEKIIASQLPLAVKIKLSHHVIWNDGSPDALLAQTKLFSQYLNDRYGRKSASSGAA